VEGSCEHGNELSGSIKCWEFLEWLHNWQLLKKGSAAWVSEWIQWVFLVQQTTDFQPFQRIKFCLKFKTRLLFNLFLLFFLPCYLGSFVFTTSIYTFSPSLSICANLSSILKSLNFLTYSQRFLSSPRPSSERSGQMIENSHSCRFDSENVPLYYLPHSVDRCFQNPDSTFLFLSSMYNFLQHVSASRGYPQA
jgi:hypothetical protein